jgi:DNA-binding SARP family transcriptional activator/tetratricopeptide (TPR) repeat protein/DNA-binding XRE family transcriptional regulator
MGVGPPWPGAAGGLRRLRLRAGYTQGELADKARVSVRTIRDLELGRVRRPQAESLQRLAAALGAAGDPDELTKRHPVEVELLGPVLVRHEGQARGIGSGMQRSLLALLALQPGQPVTHSEIIDVLWGDRPPRTARNLVHVYVGQLRRLLGPEPGAQTVQRAGGGYRLVIDRDQIDCARFDDLVAAARSSLRDGDLETSHARFADALGHWTGPVAADAEARLQQHPAAVALHARRTAAALEWADLALHSGHADAVAPFLRALAHEQPLHEGVHARLMLTLACLGEQVSALRIFADLRDRLDRELGIAPHEEVRAAHARVLRHRVGDHLTAVGTTPAQLPPDVMAFAGRVDLLSYLDGLLAGIGTAPLVYAITGPPGIGKTATAVHWAHRVRDRFGDGQLYLNLRGFDPDGRAMPITTALREVLDALGVPPPRVPASPEAQTGLYRSLVAGRRMLFVLDNAHDAEQVRPLLPGAAGCLVLVTSRSRLSGLVAADGAYPVTVDLLSGTEARELLARRVDPRRLAAEEQAVSDIIAHCAGLPLALVVVAARAATNPGFALASLAEEMRDKDTRLDALAGTDPRTDVRTVFAWSYQALPPDTARLFRLLGLHPGPDITVPAVASLAALPPPRARAALGELANAQLITEHAPGRYALHDLVRAYAAELVRSTDAEPDRAEARHRLLDHYVHAACAAAIRLQPQRDRIEVVPYRPGVVLDRPADDREAATWFSAERPVLLATVALAGDTGFDRHAWQLAWALVDFLETRGYWHDWVATQEAGLHATRRLCDRPGQAIAHRGLARAETQLGRYGDAQAHLTAALGLFEDLGDRTGMAHTHNSLAILLGRQGADLDALGHAERALRLFEVADHVAGQARAHNTVGWYHAQLGEHQQALEHCERALALHQRIGNPHGEAATWDSVGYAHHQLGQHRQAIDCFQQALDLFEHANDDRHAEATTLTHLGEAQDAAGDREAARVTWQRALSILDGLDHADGEQVRERLGRLDRPRS